MAGDIVPELLEEILGTYETTLTESEIAQNIEKKIVEGHATYADANEYALENGRSVADAFAKHLSSSTLPDGRMYFNIANRVISPVLETAYASVVERAVDVQTGLNKMAGIGLKGIRPELNKDRVDGIINKVSNAEVYDDVAWVLDEPVINFNQSIIDDTIESNFEFQGKSGLSPTITRTCVGGCCDWCREIAGVYSYPNVPQDVYRRHRYCRCTVEYHPGDGLKKRQNVHTREWTDPEKDAEIEARKKIGFEDHFHNTTPAKFSRAVEDAKAHVPESTRWRVSAYEPEHYTDLKLHVTEKGSTAAVDKFGDIVSVCSRKDDTVRGTELLKDAINNGGIKLDSFAGNHGFYIKNGFEPVSWCKWDDKHAPLDWKDEFGREPIIFYRYTGKPNNVTLEDFITQVPSSADYGTAMDIRDKKVE